QSTVFSEYLEDWIVEDNPVRVIDVFVDGLDLAEVGFSGVDPEATGRPSYHPAVLLKLYIYGYLNRVRSSRRLEREAGRNVEAMWLHERSPRFSTQQTSCPLLILKVRHNDRRRCVTGDRLRNGELEPRARG